MIGWKAGERISTSGVYPSIPLDAYHGDIAVGHSVSHTGLDRIFTGSLAHYWAKCYANPERVPDEPTEPMILGHAAHHLFLGQREFQKHYIRRPETLLGEKWQGNRKDCKAWLDKQARLGLTVLKPEMITKIEGMARSLAKEPLIQQGILGGRVECSLVSLDLETGIWKKSRPDAIPNDKGDFADLKCVASVTDEAIEHAINAYGWHRQGALNCENMADIQGVPLRFRQPHTGEGFSHTLVLVETSPPHCIEIVTLKVYDLERGVVENRAALRLLAHGLATGDFPGPSGRQRDARFLGLTDWAAKRNAYRITQIIAQLSIGRDQVKHDPETGEIA